LKKTEQHMFSWSEMNDTDWPKGFLSFICQFSYVFARGFVNEIFTLFHVHYRDEVSSV